MQDSNVGRLGSDDEMADQWGTSVGQQHSDSPRQHLSLVSNHVGYQFEHHLAVNSSSVMHDSLQTWK